MTDVEQTSAPPATVIWEGNSRTVTQSFPVAVRRGLGQELFRVQLGAKPLDSRPMQSIGAGVFELRQADRNGWYRVVYVRRVGNRVFVLHSFVKKSAKTPAKDLKIAKDRLKAVDARLAEEKKELKDEKKK